MPESITVLYVEDDPDIRTLMEIAVDGEPVELISFASGKDAVAAAPGTQADLLVLDVMMAGMDGPETLRRLREYEHLAGAPAIFMTAKAQPSEIETLMKFGASAVITKPFDPLTIADKLRGFAARDIGA